MMFRDEKLRCMKCKSTIRVKAIFGRRIVQDPIEVAKLKLWQHKHRLDCQETEETHEEVNL